MGDKPSDNRRRISDNLLDEIEKFDGKDFSEQLLKWKNDSDELSNQVAEEVEKTIKSLESVGQANGKSVEELKESLDLDNMSNSIDYTHIESLIEKHTDKVVRELSR